MRPVVLAAAALLAGAEPVMAFSTASVKFFATTDTGRDRIKIPVDPHSAADVGAGSFTIELWLKGDRAAQPATQADFRPVGSEVSYSDWINGNIFLDRDINGTPPPGSGDFGASIHRADSTSGPGVIRFGAENGSGESLSLQGSRDVLDGVWHHVALVRDATAARLRIYVDGVLDAESSASAPSGDLSYPDGLLGDSSENPFLVLAAEKHGFPGFSGFAGHLDEIRVWTVPRSETEIAASRATTVPATTPGLVLYLRLEEGRGTALVDATGLNTAVLFSGIPGDGEWSTDVPSMPTTTSTTPTASTSTTTTLPPPSRLCAVAGDCDDGDPCTPDRCESMRCVAFVPPALAVARCRLERPFDATACSSGTRADRGLARRFRERWLALLAPMNRALRLLARGREAQAGRAVQRVAAGLDRLETLIARKAGTSIDAPCPAALRGRVADVRAALAPRP